MNVDHHLSNLPSGRKIMMTQTLRFCAALGLLIGSAGASSILQVACGDTCTDNTCGMTYVTVSSRIPVIFIVFCTVTPPPRSGSQFGAFDYYATLNDTPLNGSFTMHVNFTEIRATDPACPEAIETIFVGNGEGSHHDHMWEVEEGESYALEVADKETSYDWIFNAGNEQVCTG